MTTFTYTWNASFLAQPADTDDEAEGAQRIRDTKAAVGERLNVDHYLNGDANDGKHKWIQLAQPPSIPPEDPGDGAIWAQNIGGNTEMMWRDSAGRIVQITSLGGINQGAAAIPAGSIMLFVMATPPAGWSLVTAWNDAMLRIVNGTGQGVGGGWTITGLSTQGHTLTINEMPNHDHGISGHTLLTFDTNNGAVQPGSYQLGSVAPNAQGGNAPHDHGAVASDGTWRPLYVDVIAASKN